MPSAPAASSASLPVAELWFGFAPRAHDIVQIRETWIDPYLTGDMWRVRGRQHSLLIDTGTGIAARRGQDAGARTGARPHHQRLVRPNGRPARLCRACLPRRGGSQRCLADGSPVRGRHLVSNVTLRGLPAAGYDAAAYRMRATTVTGALTDGEVIDPGDRRVKVLCMPGDTPGHVVLLEAAPGTLFLGETLFDDPQAHLRARYRSPGGAPGVEAVSRRTENLRRIAAPPGHQRVRWTRRPVRYPPARRLLAQSTDAARRPSTATDQPMA